MYVQSKTETDTLAMLRESYEFCYHAPSAHDSIGIIFPPAGF